MGTHEFFPKILERKLLFQFSLKVIQAKIDFLKWYLSVNSSEIYGKFRL
jgi:hypothetical protein